MRPQESAGPFCLPGAHPVLASSGLPACHPDQGGANDLHHETTSSAAARRDLLSGAENSPRLPRRSQRAHSSHPLSHARTWNLCFRPPEMLRCAQHDTRGGCCLSNSPLYPPHSETPGCHPERSDGSVFVRSLMLFGAPARIGGGVLPFRCASRPRLLRPPRLPSRPRRRYRLSS